MRIFDEKAVKKGFINNPNNDNRQFRRFLRGKCQQITNSWQKILVQLTNTRILWRKKWTTGVTDQQGAVRNITGWLKTFRAGKCLPSHSCKIYDHETLLLE